MANKAPNWLKDKSAKDFWLKHHDDCVTSPKQAETFAVLCQTYADFVNAVNSGLPPKERKIALDYFVKQCNLFGFYPGKATKEIKDENAIDPKIAAIFAK